MARSSQTKASALHGDERYQIDGISNAVALLKAFSRAAPLRGVADLAQEAGMSEAMTRRTLETLARHDFVSAGDDGRYALGFGWLSLSDIRRRQVGIRQIAYSVMRALRDRLNETIILSIRSDFRRVCIDNVESRQSIRRTAQSGFETPLHIGSAGKVLLAGLSDPEIDAYFKNVPLIAFDGVGLITRAEIMSEVHKIRSLGYCIAFREITSDTAAVSAPLCNHLGLTCAVITVSLPADRFSDHLKKRCIRELMKAAEEISVHLGHSPPYVSREGQ